MQDKYLPTRITAGLHQPAAATVVADLTPRVFTKEVRSQNQTSQTADNRPKHHGSETRQTQQISARVKSAIKLEVARVAKLKGWTESKTVADLGQQALTQNIVQGVAVELKNTLQQAVTTQMQKENNRAETWPLRPFIRLRR